MRTHHEAPERRRHERVTIGTQPKRQSAISTSIGSFWEMPGLCRYLSQAARLFAWSTSTCEVILRDLAARGTLCRAHDRGYLEAQLDGIRQLGLPSELATAARPAVRVTNSLPLEPRLTARLFRDTGPSS